MTHSSQRTVTVFAYAADAFDGLIRLVIDVQRFGCALKTLQLSHTAAGEAEIELSVGVPPELDEEQMMARLARHPVLRSTKIQAAK